ncbi:MAG: Lsr2 family DNA-binding protein [Dermatophilaceae bacterium]
MIGALYNVALSRADDLTAVSAHDANPSAIRSSTSPSRKTLPPDRKRSLSAPTRKAKPGAATAARRRSTVIADDAGTIRAWAQANGHTVKDRGPLPSSVRAAYATAHRV